MIVDILLVLLVVIAALLGAYAGFVAQLLRVFAVGVATAAGFFGGPGLATTVKAVRDFGPVGNQAIASLALGVAVYFAAELAIRYGLSKARTGEKRRFRFWDSLGGALLSVGVVVGLAYLALGTYQALLPVFGKPGGAMPRTAHKDSRSMSFAKRYNPLSVAMEPLRRNLETISHIRDPVKVVRRLARRPRFRTVLDHPKIRVLVRDRKLRRLLKRKKWRRILRHPGVQRVLADRRLMRRLLKLSRDPELRRYLKDPKLRAKLADPRVRRRLKRHLRRVERRTLGKGSRRRRRKRRTRRRGGGASRGQQGAGSIGAGRGADR